MDISGVLKIMVFFSKIVGLLQEHNGSVTSWMRTPEHNRAVGGVVDSDHLHGLAVDVVIDDKTKVQEFVAACKAESLYAFVESDHIHVQASPLRVKQNI